MMTDNEQTDWRRLLTPQERARMLDDIAQVSLAVGPQLFPDQPWHNLDIAVHGPAGRQSPLERLGFLERALPLLAQASDRIMRGSFTTLVTQTRTVSPTIRARRVGTQAILQAARRGPACRSLEETITVPTADTSENRAVKSFLRTLARDAVAIAALAEAEEETEAAYRATHCAAQIYGLLADPWWEGVTEHREAWRRPPTQRAQAREEYAQIFREIARFRSGFGFDWDQPLLTLPPRETWRLYEIWCLFTVLNALLAMGFVPVKNHKATSELFAVSEGRLTAALITGSPSRVALRSPQGEPFSLIYNEAFAQGEHSLSHTMQPDILLAEEYGEQRLWVLDAKFKPYLRPGEEGDDMNQMHAYRDAIVDSRGQRRVAHAWCLYAGIAGVANRARITYGNTSIGIVGGLCLRPGADETFRGLCALLSAWLPTAKPGFRENGAAPS